MKDLHPKLCHAMGIKPNHSHEVQERPFFVTEDGKGRPVMDVFA